jgi:serine/threonine-protein kinase
MFARVVELIPDQQRGYNNLGSMYLLMGRYDDALRVFLASTAKEPAQPYSKAQAYSNVGTANYFLGRYGDAANAFEKATELAPKIYLYWGNLGDAYRWIPNAAARANVSYDRAIQLADGELKVNPTATTIRVRMAVWLAKRGNIKRADDEIRNALTADPNNPTYIYKAAMIANVEGRSDDAARLIESALAKGYSRADAEHEREFENLRRDGRLQQVLQRTATITGGSATQPKTGR